MIRKAFIAAVLFLAPSRASVRPAPALQIAVEDAADPWSRADGTGFANDVVRAAYRAVDVEVQFIVVPYARCKNMVVEGAVAACFAMSPSPDLQGKVLFPATPLFLCNTELVQNPARALPGAHLRDLPRGTVIGTVLGYEYPKEVLQAERAGAIVFDASPTEGILLRKLAAKRVAAVLVNVNESKPIEYVAALAGVMDGFQPVERVGVLQSYIGFSVRNARGAWARDTYEEGMRRIMANGSRAVVVRRWSDSSQAKVRALRDGKRSRP